MQHKLDKEEISHFKISSTSKPCPICGYHKSNLTEHRKYCKIRTVAVQETTKEKNQSEERQDVPEGLNPGGSILNPKFESFLAKQVIAETTQRKYFKKMVGVCLYWEKKIRGFRTDGLIWPLEKGMLFPDLAGYLADSTSPGDKASAIKAYLHFCKFVKELCSLRYTADETFSMLERKAFTDSIREYHDDNRRLLKGLNRASSLITAENNMDKQEKQTELGHNPERLKEAVVYILEHHKVEEMLKDLTTMASEEISDKYTEVEARNFLLGMLMITADGQRPHSYGKKA